MGNADVLLTCHAGRRNLVTGKRLAGRYKQRILYGITLVEMSGPAPQRQPIDTSCPGPRSQEELRSLVSGRTHIAMPSPRFI